MVCRINLTPNKSQSTNSYANSDIIHAYFKYSNPSFIQTLSSKIIGSPVVSTIDKVTQFL